MSASIGAFLSTFPASKVLIGDVENNHGHLRFPWMMVFGDGRPDLRGDDHAVLDENGRIRLVASFDAATPSHSEGSQGGVHSPVRSQLT
jgi:hypothetical protein